ncbi:MAG: glycosyltransferase family 39 protein [Chloroflexi bacterium]|nr:glycosyltransferase family 39 protein [Chloroflexota bacterium]
MGFRTRAASLPRPFPWEWAACLCIVGIGAALRFYALGRVPYGIYHDEAFYGLDAMSVLRGAHPIFFSANNGREPLYIYLLSLSVAAFGRTPFGLRFASAVIGTLTIPATYLLGRALFNRRVGLLAMAVCAVTFWPVALSRVSFRAGALPLFLGLAVALGWLGVQRRKLPLAILGGVAYGLAFNTYTAARVTPLAFAVFVVIAVWFCRTPAPVLPRSGGAGGERQENRLINSAISALSAVNIEWREVIAFLISTILVVAPLGVYALAHRAQVFAREGQVSILETERGGSLVASLAKHAALAAGMFGGRGDTIARHNLPGRPVFDAWTFLFFVAGLGWLAVHSRKRPSAAFVLVWLAVAIAPTVLAEDTPHFLRSIAMLPVLWLVPALGFEALWVWRPARWTAALVGALLCLSAVVTARDYFGRYANDPVTGYYFESAATGLAGEINSRPDFAARIDDRLWDNFASLRFLVPNRNGSGSADRVQLAVWPYEANAIKAAVAALPPGSLISAHRGALARGDLEATPFSLYTIYLAEPASPSSVVAEFGGVLALRSARLSSDHGVVRVQLQWQLAAAPVEVDYHVYVHVLSDGALSAQADGEPLKGLYHFSWLRPGDVLDDVYELPAGDGVVVGLYGPDGAPLGEALTLK